MVIEVRKTATRNGNRKREAGSWKREAGSEKQGAGREEREERERKIEKKRWKNFLLGSPGRKYRLDNDFGPARRFYRHC